MKRKTRRGQQGTDKGRTEDDGRGVLRNIPREYIRTWTDERKAPCTVMGKLHGQAGPGAVWTWVVEPVAVAVLGASRRAGGQLGRSLCLPRWDWRKGRPGPLNSLIHVGQVGGLSACISGSTTPLRRIRPLDGWMGLAAATLSLLPGRCYAVPSIFSRRRQVETPGEGIAHDSRIEHWITMHGSMLHCLDVPPSILRVQLDVRRTLDRRETALRRTSSR